MREQLLTQAVLDEVQAERERQTRKHGDQSHLPDGTGPFRFLWLPARDGSGSSHGYSFRELAHLTKARCKAASQNEGGDGTITFEHILTEEFFEALAEDDPVLLRTELVQVAAAAVQWIEAIDRRREKEKPAPVPEVVVPEPEWMSKPCTCEYPAGAEYGVEPASEWGCPQHGAEADAWRAGRDDTLKALQKAIDHG